MTSLEKEALALANIAIAKITAWQQLNVPISKEFTRELRHEFSRLTCSFTNEQREKIATLTLDLFDELEHKKMRKLFLGEISHEK